MFSSKLKSLLYIFLRNDLSWSLLSKQERKQIIDANNQYNTLREDYFDIKKFGISRQKGGERWDTYDFKVLLKNNVKGEDASYLHSKLNEYMPQDVLEIGSGPGLFSKMLFDHSSVKSLTINDINPQFIQFVKLCFDQEENNFKKFNSILGDIRNSDLKNKFDMIVIISSLHHIPYRVSLFQKMESMLKDQGVLIICEPVHNLLRLYHLLKKLKIFLRKEFMSDTSNYSTHHMCSKREYIGILKQCKYLKIEDLVYGKIPPRFSSTILLNSSFFRKKLATRIFTTFRKKST